MAADPQMVRKRGEAGTNAFGIYVDYVVYHKTAMPLGVARLVRQERFFLADNVLCKYVRQHGNARAAWRAFPLPSHDDARKLLLRNISKYKDDGSFTIEMVHVPLLVELTATDIEALKKHEPPMARFEGTRVAEKMTGKIDDDAWAPR